MEPFTFFISYRREDTAPVALLLKAEIEKRLQFVRVSVDVEDIGAGEHFPDRIEAMINASHAAIVLIGKQWMPTPAVGSALPASIDWVIHELEYARTAPFTPRKGDGANLEQRMILPIFIDCASGFDKFALAPAIKYLCSLNAEHITYANWPRLIGPLIERLAAMVHVERRQGEDTYPKPDLAKARTQPLPDDALTAILKYDDYEGWYIDNFGLADVRYLVKTFKFSNFAKATEFMKIVSNHCQILDHHPEWRNVFNCVNVSLTTWDAKRNVTIYDLNLALFMNMAARAVVKNKQPS